jgi:FlaA1/EpsC-like NDP-sugar epimerase
VTCSSARLARRGRLARFPAAPCCRGPARRLIVNVRCILGKSMDSGDRTELEMNESGQKQGHILVTGVAGFIGMHVARRLLKDGYDVIGVDNLNTYYDPDLMKRRLGELAAFSNFCFDRIDIADRKALADLFAAYRFSHVVHLAAQAGVRHSLTMGYLLI